MPEDNIAVGSRFRLEGCAQDCWLLLSCVMLVTDENEGNMGQRCYIKIVQGSEQDARKYLQDHPLSWNTGIEKLL
jgi:hypothetical protein